MDKQPILIRLAAIATLSTVCAVNAAPLPLAAYSQARDDLKALYKGERDACSSLSGNQRDVCVETAKGREKVALAHLQYQRSGTAADRGKLDEARYEARYEIAKERCDDQSGRQKDLCLTQARADRDKAKADLKLAKEVTVARQEAIDAKLSADYKVARERCDAMSGSAKDACVATARARYGQ